MAAVPLRISELRRPFSSDATLRRVVSAAAITQGMRVLEVDGGADGLGVRLAKELSCEVICAEGEEAGAEAVRAQARALGVQNKLEAKKVPLNPLPFAEGSFGTVIVHAGSEIPARQAAARYGKYVEHNGRLVLVAVVRVGRFPNSQVVEFWESRTGETLALPRDLLATLDAVGFEPETAESLSDLELDQMYRASEQALPDDGRAEPFREEIALHRGQGGKSSYSFVFVVGRRKEPGEKPAAARTRG